MNPVYNYSIVQGSEEWLNIKIGKFSASTADCLLMDKKLKGYQGLIDRIVEERITGQRCENGFKGNFATDRGNELEAIARQDYELRNLQSVKLIGVVELDDWTLCSPDGLIDEDGLHQIKCPLFSTHKEYLSLLKEDKQVIDAKYYKQMQFELFVTGRDYNVFTSFHPYLRAIDIRLERDEAMIAEIGKRLAEAKIEVENEINRIKNL